MIVVEMPCQFDDDILGVLYRHYPGDEPRRPEAYSMVNPPIGFFPFAANGCGDYQGFYWPIGREAGGGIIAFHNSNVYSLVPEYSDLSAAARCEIAKADDGTLMPDLQEALVVAGINHPSSNQHHRLAAGDHCGLLALDENSPFRQCAVGDLKLSVEQWSEAEARYRCAIDLLPEYGAAHFGLGFLLRRLRRQQEAAVHLRMALMGPTCFWGSAFWADHVLPGTFRNDWPRKALLWLQQTREFPPSLADDPFLKRIKQLKLIPGESTTEDLPLLIEIVDEYASRAQFTEAVHLWINVGDRMWFETTAFRERHQFTSRRYANRLAELLRGGGNSVRAALVESTLAAMSKPDGLYL